LKIGFDISQTGASKAGCGYFAENLIKHLAKIDSGDTYILYPTFGDLFWEKNWRRSTFKPNDRMTLKIPATTFEQSRAFWRNPPPDLEGKLGTPDIVHSNNYFCPKGLSHARLVYTLYDLSFLENPEWTLEENRSGCFAGVFQAAVNADFVMAISEHTRRDFTRTFPHYPTDRVAVVHGANRLDPQTAALPPKAAKALGKGHFWLSVGTLEPRKNHSRLLQAFATLRSKLKTTIPLVIVGADGWMMEDFYNTLRELNIRDSVILLGKVPDPELLWLYQNCFCLVYPSLYEGFGLPLVEAMSQGAPVISSLGSSLEEVVGSAGLLADPFCVEAISGAMEKLATGEVPREVLRQRSLQRAGEFSWDASAKAVIDIYYQVQRMPRLRATDPS